MGIVKQDTFRHDDDVDYCEESVEVVAARWVRDASRARLPVWVLICQPRSTRKKRAKVGQSVDGLVGGYWVQLSPSPRGVQARNRS